MVSNETILIPFEIADVVVDFLVKVRFRHFIFWCTLSIPVGKPVTDFNGKVMKFVIRKNKEVDTWHVLDTLMNYPSPNLSRASQTRYIAMYEYMNDIGQPTHLFINGKAYDQPATETPKAGTRELWNVINLTGDNHTLHIHIELFAVVD